MRFFFVALLLITRLSIAQNKFDSNIAAFEATDRQTPPPKHPIVFTGSSSIVNWGSLVQDFSGKPVLNRGFGGSELSDVRHFADRVILAYKPKQVVVYAGENDIANDHSAQETCQRFVDLFIYVRQHQPDVPFDFISIKLSPSRRKYWPIVQEANTLIKQYMAKQKNARFIDIRPAMNDANGHLLASIFRPDSLHMNPSGYALWVPVVKPYLR
jgi:lysophospholipase L1-like esterase